MTNLKTDRLFVKMGDFNHEMGTILQSISNCANAMICTQFAIVNAFNDFCVISG